MNDEDQRNESLRTSQHGDTSVVSEQTPHSGNNISSASPMSSSERAGVPNEPSIDHSRQDSQGSREQHTGGGGDTEGGSGDTKEDRESALNTGQSATSLREDHVKSSHTVSGSVLKMSESRSSYVKSSGGGEERLEGADESSQSKESMSITDVHQIVVQIVHEIIDAVIQTDERLEELSLGDEIKSHGDERRQLSSVTTIKSEDDKGSVHIDPDIQAQLILEQETALLEKQKIHQSNIVLYHTLVAARANLKRRNTFLLRQMYEHYKRKKIEHLFKEMPIANMDMEGKYIKALLAFEEVQKTVVDEELGMRERLSALEEKMEAVETDLNQEWNNLIMREREIAKGMLTSQAAKQVPEKQNVEGMIQRQIAKAKELTKERLIYFKLRDIAAADESHLKSLENLGDNLTLMDYEQLKMQSQSCVEKLEERDADLHRLRCKATSAIQILAEIREKTHTLLEDIEANKVILHDVNQKLIQTRERVGCEKKRRDMSRSDTVRLRQEAGLLSEPKLLQDYKESFSLKEILQDQLHEWKGRFESQKVGILNLRKELVEIQQKDDNPVWTSNKGLSNKFVKSNVLI